MPKEKSNNKTRKEEFSPKKKDIAGVLISTASIILLISLISPDPSALLGDLGDALSLMLKSSFGVVALIIPIFGFWWAYNEFKHKKLPITWHSVWGAVVFVMGVSVFLHLLKSGRGGESGRILAIILERFLGLAGSYIVSSAMIMISLILLTDIPVREVAKAIVSLFSKSATSATSAAAKLKKDKPARPNIIISSSSENNKKRNKEEKKKEDKKSAQKKETKASSESKADTSESESKTVTASEEEIPEEYSIPEDFLNELKNIKVGTEEEEARGEAIVEVLKNFNIESEVSGIQIGPSITRYEIHLPNPVQLSKIRNLSSNIAMATQARTVRLLTPIPGKSAVGVELPALSQETVPIKSLITSDEFEDFDNPIPYCLGKAVSGELKIGDLASMPHLLLAGATGSGKSVAIHTLIVSILYKSSPSDAVFVMIDPKRVELAVYNGIPHLTSDVITNSSEAVEALAAIAKKMDERYDLLASYNVANIDEYNKIDGVEKMPRMVVVIDELADLMVMARDRVENAIIRIAQMARAVGIHLVLATQRPSVDVITGIIKANLPARIAFNVLSGVDSRTILDVNGAEKLLGKGDMLFQSSELPQPERIQGCFITREEIKKITSYLSSIFSGSRTIENLSIPEERAESSGRGSYEDELYPEAVKIAIKHNKASISFLQRKLRIGYNRAAKIIDRMEENGVVGEDEGGVRARNVLVGKDYLETL